MSQLRLENISVIAGDRALLKSISCELTAGECVVLLGSNGAGKTTLLRSILGHCTTASGTITLNGEGDPRTLNAEQRAKHIAYLPQMRTLAWPIDVHTAVGLGRYAHTLDQRGQLSEQDQQAIDQAIRDCDLTAFADRSTASLSGGELARVHIARAFATQAPILLADEPIDALDPLHQWQVMQLIKRYTRQGNCALIALHDIALAARFADRVILLKAGEVIASGPVDTTLTEAHLATTYGVEVALGELKGQPIASILGPETRESYYE